MGFRVFVLFPRRWGLREEEEDDEDEERLFLLLCFRVVVFFFFFIIIELVCVSEFWVVGVGFGGLFLLHIDPSHCFECNHVCTNKRRNRERE